MASERRTVQHQQSQQDARAKRIVPSQRTFNGKVGRKAGEFVAVLGGEASLIVRGYEKRGGVHCFSCLKMPRPAHTDAIVTA